MNKTVRGLDAERVSCYGNRIRDIQLIWVLPRIIFYEWIIVFKIWIFKVTGHCCHMNVAE